MNLDNDRPNNIVDFETIQEKHTAVTNMLQVDSTTTCRLCGLDSSLPKQIAFLEGQISNYRWKLFIIYIHLSCTRIILHVSGIGRCFTSTALLSYMMKAVATIDNTYFAPRHLTSS